MRGKENTRDGKNGGSGTKRRRKEKGKKNTEYKAVYVDAEKESVRA